MELIIAESVKTALDVPWEGLETGWLLLGRIGRRRIDIAHAITAGPKAIATGHSIRMDAEFQVSEARRLRQGDSALCVVGTAHTHAPVFPWPSQHDLDGDLAWLAGLPQGRAVFGIVSDRLRWFYLEANDADYTELTVSPRLDAGA